LKIASEFGNYFISEKIPVKTCEIFLAASVKKYMDLLLYTPLKRKNKKEKRKKKKEKRKKKTGGYYGKYCLFTFTRVVSWQLASKCGSRASSRHSRGVLNSRVFEIISTRFRK